MVADAANVTEFEPLSTVQLLLLHVPPLTWVTETLPPVPAVAATVTCATKFAVHVADAVGFVNVIALPLCV